MPILNNSDAIIRRLGLNTDTYGSALPDQADVANTFSSYARNAAQEGFARAQFSNMGVGYQRLTGNVMRTIGAPHGDGVLGNSQFDGSMGLLRIDDIASELLGALGSKGLLEIAPGMPTEIQEILMDLLNDMLAPLMAQLGSIPVYGWILEAVFDLILGIVKIVKIFKEQNEPDDELEYSVAGFSADADIAVAAELMKATRTSSNWTDLYMPPGIGRNQTYGGNFFVEKLTDGIGYRITSAGAHETWAGLVPGTSRINHGFELFNEGALTRGVGDLFPTARNLNVSMWDQINKKFTPAMYTVDADRCMHYWEGHLRQMLEHLILGPHKGVNTNGGMGPKYAGAEAFVGTGGVIPSVGEEYFNWSPWDDCMAAVKKWRTGGYDGDQDAYLDDLGVSRRTPDTPASAMRILYENQLAGLNTTMCAYVHRDTFGSMGSPGTIRPERQALIDRYEKNRMTLLGHPARCDIDTANIPDHVYKSKMEEVQEQCLPSHLGKIAPRITEGGSRRRRHNPLGKFLDSSGGTPVNQSPGGRRLRGKFDLDFGAKDSSGGGGMVLALGGLAALIMMMRNR